MKSRSVQEHGHQRHLESMLSVEDALERILGFFHMLNAEKRPILEAHGQVLAEDVVSQFDIPSMDNSAMDGYAVQAASVRGASMDSPVVLQVIGTIAAGQLPHEEVGPGTAVRVMTGAPIPVGADAIVPFEDTDELARKHSSDQPKRIGIFAQVERAADIRQAAQDVRAGERILESGTVLKAAHIGLLASLGRSEVEVIRRPEVAVLATGDELIDPQEAYVPGKIYNSNSHSVAAEVVRAGGRPRMLGIARDSLESLESKFRDGLGSDLLITTAGVSKGDYDMVKDALARQGNIEFWSVRMRPAKPLAFGLLHGPNGTGIPHLGLPGNPVSALVAFEQFARPAIHQMMGKTVLNRPTIDAVLKDSIYNTDGRRVYARAIVTDLGGTYSASLTGPQSSNLLTSMARANGLAICPEDVPVLEAGEVVKVQMIDWPEVVS